MKLTRKSFLHLAAGAVALPALPRNAKALDYPTRPVRMIVGFPPGAGSDITARLVGPWLSERCGQQFIIENRPGAGGNIGTEVVVKAPPDGYTLLIVTPPHAINATLYKDLQFNFIRDISPIAGILRAPLVMVVNPSFPAKTLLEFIAYAKANPGKISMASSGNGSTSHLAGELFKMMSGVNLVHVPYRGSGQAITDLLGERVQVMFDVMTASIAHIGAGKLRALAVTSAARSTALPDIPSVSEFLPGYEASSWLGIGAPKNTSAEIIEKLNSEINAVLAEPKMKAQIVDLGDTVLALSPSGFGKVVVDETEKWGKVIRDANVKLE